MTAPEMSVIEDTPTTTSSEPFGPLVPVIKRRKTRHWKSIARAAERLAAERLDDVIRLEGALHRDTVARQDLEYEAAKWNIISLGLGVALLISFACNLWQALK